MVKRFEDRPASYTARDLDGLVIRNEAVAVNPVYADVKLAGSAIFPWLKYPYVHGSDMSGVGVEDGGRVEKLIGHSRPATASSSSRRRDR